MKHLLQAIGLSKSTYHFEITKDNPITIRNEELTKEIVALFNKHKGRYGDRRIFHELKKQRHSC